MREIFEETGERVRIEGLVDVVQKDRMLKEAPEEVHRKIDFIFRCTLLSEYNPKLGGKPDMNQTGVQWLDFSSIDSYDLRPKRIKERLLKERASMAQDAST